MDIQGYISELTGIYESDIQVVKRDGFHIQVAHNEEFFGISDAGLKQIKEMDIPCISFHKKYGINLFKIK